MFTPLFLVLELVSALGIWLLIAFRSQSLLTSLPSSASSSTSSGEDDDDKSGIKVEEDESLSPEESLARNDRLEFQAAQERISEARRRAGLRMGVGDTGVLGSQSMEEDLTDVEPEEEEEGSGSGASWEGVEAEEDIKAEDEDDTATVGGVS